MFLGAAEYPSRDDKKNFRSSGPVECRRCVSSGVMHPSSDVDLRKYHTGPGTGPQQTLVGSFWGSVTSMGAFD